MTIRAVVWGENVHEQTSKEVRALYPDGMHATIAAALTGDGAIEASTAALQQPEHGLECPIRVAGASVVVDSTDSATHCGVALA